MDRKWWQLAGNIIFISLILRSSRCSPTYIEQLSAPIKVLSLGTYQWRSWCTRRRKTAARLQHHLQLLAFVIPPALLSSKSNLELCPHILLGFWFYVHDYTCVLKFIRIEKGGGENGEGKRSKEKEGAAEEILAAKVLTCLLYQLVRNLSWYMET